MMAAVRAGKFVWHAPVGYINGPKNGPSLVPDSAPIVELVQKAWRLAESGMPPGEVGAKLVKEGFCLRSGKAPSPRSLRAILKCETYTGYINAFGMRIRGDFEPLIDPDLFFRVQKMFTKASHAVSRPYKKLNPDFPLRGTIMCPHCDQLLTASWSRGHGGKYAYYRCTHCKGVDFRKQTLEPKFADHLNNLSLKPSLLDRLSREVEAGLREDATSSRRALQELEARLADQRKRREQVVEKSLNNVLPDENVRRLLAESDQRIQEIEAEKQLRVEDQDIDSDMVKAGLVLLDKMGSLWKRSDSSTKTQLQRFVFPNGTTFNGESFGTSALPACLQLGQKTFHTKTILAPRVGLEPTTPGLTVQCYHR